MTLVKMDQKGSSWTSGGTVHGVPQVFNCLTYVCDAVVDSRLLRMQKLHKHIKKPPEQSLSGVGAYKFRFLSESKADVIVNSPCHSLS